jgi:hypothetical protein
MSIKVACVRSRAMAGPARRALTVVAGLVVLAGPAAGVANASLAPALGWSPMTSPGTYGYGTVKLGHAASQVFTLTNSGSGPSRRLKITLTGSAAFSKMSGSCGGISLGPGTSCSVTVKYAPTSHGQTDTATLTAVSGTITASVALQGAAAKASPALTGSPGAGGTAGSATVTDTAKLSGGSSPTGTIEFKLYGPSMGPSCSGGPVDDETLTVSGDGKYTTPAGATPSQAGTYWWTVSYSGDTANNPAAVTCGAQSVAITMASPVIATAPSAGGAVGTAVTDAAALAGGDNPTGTIEFTLYGPSPAAGCSGTPVFDQGVAVSGDGGYTSPSFTPAQPGSYWWAASYSGDTSNNPVASGCDQQPVTVSKATAALAAAPGATGMGTAGTTAVTDTAALAGSDNATGTIEFTLYGPSATASCTGTPVFDQGVPVSGDGSYTSPSFTPAQPGSYWWIASYSGDTNNNPAATTCGSQSVTINAASPAISATASAGGPAGTTTLTDTATLAGSDNATGTIEFTLYGPSATASCTGTPVDDETVPVSGDGTYTTPAGAIPTQVGTYWWIASYSGDTANNPAATSCGSQSVTLSIGTPVFEIDPSLGPFPVGTAVSDTVTVAGGASPTGTLDFELSGPSVNCLGGGGMFQTVPVNGDGTYTSPSVTPGLPGTYWWYISYSGDTNNAPYDPFQCETETQLILWATPALTTSPSAGGPPGTTVTDTASFPVSQPPGGGIEFTLYGPSATPNCTGTPVDDETARLSPEGGGLWGATTPAGATPTQPGTYWWIASYSGDNTYYYPATTNCGDESVTITP